ncbi:hypothetical protein HPT14_27035, partial [Pseudomonas aeruginosa]|nr:hypothetical protein [Pseudomonas aeruginosa]
GHHAASRRDRGGVLARRLQLISQHHPDKLAGAGASVERVRAATEKTRELQAAYALVREREGFR